MTLSDLLADVRSRIDESAASFWTDAELKRWMNQRYRQIAMAVRDAHEDFFQTTTTVNLVNGTQEYTLPTDHVAIRRVEVSFDGTNWYRARPIRQGEIPLQNQSTVLQGTTTDPRYYLAGLKIGIAPIPTAASTNGLKIWYIQDVTDLSADGDAPSLPTVLHPLISKFAAGDALKKDEEDARGKALVEEAETELRRLVAQIKPRIEDEPRYVNYIPESDLVEVSRS